MFEFIYIGCDENEKEENENEENEIVVRIVGGGRVWGLLVNEHIHSDHISFLCVCVCMHGEENKVCICICMYIFVYVCMYVCKGKMMMSAIT